MADQSPSQGSSRFRTDPSSPTPTRKPVLQNPFVQPPAQGSPSERYIVDTNKAPSAPVKKRKRSAEGKKTKKRKPRKPRKSKKNKKSKRRTKRR
jgi:hypothetical protein